MAEIAQNNSQGWRLSVEVGSTPGAWIALQADKTIIGESGIEWLMVERVHDRFLLSALDPTTLVMLNHDPLPPTAIAIYPDDTIGVNDYTLRLVQAA